MALPYHHFLEKLGISALNPMQEKALDAVSTQRNIILTSPTGSGKTLAFLLPCALELRPEPAHVQLLVIVPSRELALQTEQVFRKMGTGFKVSVCYGGHAVGIEENNLAEPPAVLIGTPGRIAHHLRSGTLDFSRTGMLVLDEFDKSLEAGFEEDLSWILSRCKALKKRVLTSATGGGEVSPFVGLDNPVFLNFNAGSEAAKDSLCLKQITVPGDDKLEALLLLLGKTGPRSTIVFCNHRDAVERIALQLSDYRIAHGIYHGGMEQIDREKTLIRLRNGSIRLLIATDLASRGLDIPEIEVIIHYQLPLTSESLVHRNGRTARMHASGTVYFLLDQGDRLPPFLDVVPEQETLPRDLVMPPPADWTTLYISAGRKDKINKMDIVGMFLQKGGLAREELGRIEVLDHAAYVAVKASCAKKLLAQVRGERIKNARVKIQEAN